MVGVNVGVKASVGVAVEVAVGVNVAVAVGVNVAVGATVGVKVGVKVTVGVAVEMAVGVNVAVSVAVGVAVGGSGVKVGVKVGVTVGGVHRRNLCRRRWLGRRRCKVGGVVVSVLAAGVVPQGRGGVGQFGRAGRTLVLVGAAVADEIRHVGVVLAGDGLLVAHERDLALVCGHCLTADHIRRGQRRVAAAPLGLLHEEIAARRDDAVQRRDGPVGAASRCVLHRPAGQ
ncbi:MAG: hypothetical protein R2851_05575 [Caldilineaceae bacterium]